MGEIYKKSTKKEHHSLADAPLVRVMHALDARERAQVQRWVESPAFNRREEVVRLYRHLCSVIPVGDGAWPPPEALYKPVVYKAVFAPNDPKTGRKKRPDQPLQPLDTRADASLRYTMSFLFSAIKQWLAWQEWSKEPLDPARYLCRALRRRGLPDMQEKVFRDIPAPAQDTMQSADYYLAAYQLQLEHWESTQKQGGGGLELLKTLNLPFGAFVAVSALRHGCAALDKPDEAFRVSDIAFLPEVMEKTANGAFDDVPAAMVYYHCFRLMLEKQETHFVQLKHLLLTHATLFPPEELRDVWLVAINYCIRRLNAGERNWAREAFMLYRSGLERELLLEHGKMPKATYQNIMLLAIAGDEWDWARAFLDRYRPSLAPGERYNAYQFNLAMWHFRRKEYPEAQEILRNVEFRDVYYNLDARRMMVRMYFDEGAMQALDSLLHSFRTYLQRHRNIGYHRDLNANFVRMVFQALRLPPGDTAARLQLLEKVKTERYLAEREWLMAVLS